MDVAVKSGLPRGLFYTVSAVYSFVYVLLSLSLVSFSSSDNSFTSVEVSKYSSSVDNIFGSLGAYVSDLLLIFMGIGAFFIPVLMARPLFVLWQQRKVSSGGGSAAYFLFSIVISFALVLMVSFTLGFVWGTTPFLESYLSFGIVGAVSKVILSSFVGGVGGIIMAVFLLPFLVILYLSSSFENIGYNLKNPSNPFSRVEYLNNFLQEAFALKKNEDASPLMKKVVPVVVAVFAPMMWVVGIVGIVGKRAKAARRVGIDLSGKRTGDGRSHVAQSSIAQGEQPDYPSDSTQTASFQYAETLAANLAYPTAPADNPTSPTETATPVTPQQPYSFSFQPPNLDQNVAAPHQHMAGSANIANIQTPQPQHTAPQPNETANTTNTFMGGLINERRGIMEIGGESTPTPTAVTVIIPANATATPTPTPTPTAATTIPANATPPLPTAAKQTELGIIATAPPLATSPLPTAAATDAPAAPAAPAGEVPAAPAGEAHGVLNIASAIPRTIQDQNDTDNSAGTPTPTPMSTPTPAPVSAVTPSPVVSAVTPAPVSAVTPSPVNAVTPASVNAVTPSPVVSAVTPLFDDEVDYIVPYTLLQSYTQKRTGDDDASLWAEADVLNKRLNEFGIGGRITHISSGPVVITYEFEPAPGVKVSRITALSDDIALAMSVTSVRVIAPIPGKGVVGFEIPRRNREMVVFKQLIDDPMFKDSNADLNIAIGQDVNGKPFFADLAKMPHVLIAGTTGSGKSVAINTIICSLIYNHSPSYVKFIMIDPKMVELSIYDDIPHLAAPVVTDTKIAAKVLRNVVKEMEQRYALLKDNRAKSITSYNAKAENSGLDKLSYLVVIVDEFADLMMVAGKEVEQSVIRLAQMARAVGIHLILATQRPSVDVITGIIKANMPSRLGFKVSSKVDSRTVIDRQGAEQLLGNGDSLFIMSGKEPIRLHGAFISEDEVNDIADHLRTLGEPEYDMALIQQDTTSLDNIDDDELDEKYYEAVEIVTQKGFASISMVQRHLRIGYNRAARIVEIMEQKGVVAPSDGSSKPREVLQKPNNEAL